MSLPAYPPVYSFIPVGNRILHRLLSLSHCIWPIACLLIANPSCFLAPLLLCFFNRFYLAGDPRSIPGSGSSPGEGIGYPLQYSWASPVAQLLKNPPAMQETWVRSLGWEDPLEKGKATRSRILAWRIPWTIWGRKESDTTELTFTFTNCIFFQIYV